VTKNMLEVYALAACFVSMIIVIVSTSECLYGVLRMLGPSATVTSYAHERSIGDDQFLKAWPKDQPKPEPSTISQLRTEAWASDLRIERHEGLTSFLKSLTYAITAGLVWSRTSRSKWMYAGEPGSAHLRIAS
jgi:hypothetical protein